MNANSTVKLICHRNLPLLTRTHYCTVSKEVSACNRLHRNHSVFQSKLRYFLNYRQYSHARTLCKIAVDNSLKHRSRTYFISNNIRLIRCHGTISSPKSTASTSTTVSEEEDLNNLFPLRYIFVNTSLTRWVEFPNGLAFDVGYVDSMSYNHKVKTDSIPVILGIPDVTGDHSELTQVLKPLAKSGYRVIVPNLPGTAYCKERNRVDNTAYQMSVSEHSEFINDFLSELKIERVDMVVSNRHSVYTAVNLCATQKDFFHSLAMINPTGLHYTKMMKPLVIYKRIGIMFENRMVIQEVIRGVIRIVKLFLNKRHWSALQVITYSRNLSTLSFKDEENRANQLQIRDKPLLACYGNDNKLLDTKSSKAYLTLLGIPESSFIEIQDDTSTKTGTIREDKVAYHILTDSENILDTHTMFIRRKLWNFFRSNCLDKTRS